MFDLQFQCLRDPRVGLPCQNCHCGAIQKRYFFGGDRRVSNYIEGLNSRGISATESEILAHLKVLDANIRLYSKPNLKQEYSSVHKYQRDDVEKFIFFEKHLNPGPILVIGSLFDEYIAVHRDIVYLDIPTDNNSSSNTIRADGILLPFPDNYFAGVYANHVLHHIFEPLFLIYEAMRVVRDGGVFQSHGDPNRKLPPIRKKGIAHKAYRGIYWGLRYLLDNYLLYRYPPRDSVQRAYDTEDSALAEYHDYGIHAERGFNSRSYEYQLKKRYGEVNFSFSWDHPKSLPLTQNFLIHMFLVLGYGRNSCMENISIRIKK
jgi:SAM-dependent methyltransferase